MDLTQKECLFVCLIALKKAEENICSLDWRLYDKYDILLFLSQQCEEIFMQMKVSEANEVEGNLSGMFRHMEMRDCVGVIKSWNPCSQETGSMLFYIVNHQQCVNWRLLFLLRLLVRLPERGNFCPPAICAEQQGGSISPLCLRKCTHTVNSARILKMFQQPRGI